MRLQTNLRIARLYALADLRAGRKRKHGGGAATAVVASGPTTYASDSFNRSDRALSGDLPDVGSAWLDLAGTWNVISNRAGISIDAFTDVTRIDTGQTDGALRLTIGVIGSDGMAIAARIIDSSNLIWQRETGGALSMFRRTGGSNNAIGSALITGVAGDTNKLVMTGNTLDAYQNDILQFTVTESQGNTATKHGLFGSDLTSRIDDWSHKSA